MAMCVCVHCGRLVAAPTSFVAKFNTPQGTTWGVLFASLKLGGKDETIEVKYIIAYICCGVKDFVKDLCV